MNYLAWGAILLLPSVLWQFVVHELAHATALTLLGIPSSIRFGFERMPWGGWRFARTTADGVDQMPLTAAAAPRLLNVCQVSGVAAWWGSATPLGRGFLLAGGLCALVDFSAHTLGIFLSRRATDPWQTFEALPWQPGLALYRALSAVVVVVLWTGALWRLL